MSSKKSRYEVEADCLDGSDDEDDSGPDEYDMDDGFMIDSDEDTDAVPQKQQSRIQPHSSNSISAQKKRGRPLNSRNKPKEVHLQQTTIDQIFPGPVMLASRSTAPIAISNAPAVSVTKTPTKP